MFETCGSQFESFIKISNLEDLKTQILFFSQNH